MVSQGMANFFPDPSNSGDWKGYYDIGKPDLVRFSESLGSRFFFCRFALRLFQPPSRRPSAGLER